MSARTLVLVRHGQSEWNADHRIQGQSGSGLSEVGRQQSERTAAWLAESYPDAVLYSSDLTRAAETARPAAAWLGRDVIVRTDLRERAFGDWTGLTAAEVESRWPDLWRRWRGGDDVVAEVGGESTEALTRRAVEGFHGILELLEPGGTAVCVTHGGVIWHGVRSFLDLPGRVLGGVGNTSITELQVADGRPSLALWNQVGHLPIELRTWFRPSEAAAIRPGASSR